MKPEPVVDLARLTAGRKTFAAVTAFVETSQGPRYGWCVAAARRGSGLTARRGFRQLVAGPFGRKIAASMVAKELRTGTCAVHEDCAAIWEMGRECYVARYGRASEPSGTT